MNTKRQGQFLIRFAYFAVILAIAIFICRYGIPALLPFVVAFVVSLLLLSGEAARITRRYFAQRQSE